MALVEVYQKLLDLHSWIPYHFAGLLRGWALPMARVQIEATSRCNLKCFMCNYAEPNVVNPRQQPLSREEYLDLIAQVPRFSLISFTGGEPFMNPDFLEILAFAARKHRCHVITNGMLIKPDTARRLVELGTTTAWRSGLLLLGVSIHGERDTHNEIVGSDKAFDLAIEGIGQINEARVSAGKSAPQVNLQCVITEKNFTQLREIVELAAKVKVKIVNFIIENEYKVTYDREEHGNDITEGNYNMGRHQLPAALLSKSLYDAVDLAGRLGVTARLSPWGITIPEIVRFYEGRQDLARYNCVDPWSTILISPFGEATHCLNLNFGNIRDRKLSKIYNGKRFREFRLRLKQNRLFDECAGCCWLRYHGGGDGPGGDGPVAIVDARLDVGGGVDAQGSPAFAAPLSPLPGSSKERQGA